MCLQVGGKASDKLKKLLVVLLMTLPGSPAVEQDSDIDGTEVRCYIQIWIMLITVSVVHCIYAVL